ncbi:S2P metalloprotease [Sulfolobales archaeon HS-7]|nr:S2P metalloprotease [Sulfolobales archaeon HS-7]
MQSLIIVELILLAWILLSVALSKKAEYLSKKGITLLPLLLIWRRKSRSEWLPTLTRSRAFKVFNNILTGVAFISMALGIYLVVSVILSSFTMSHSSAKLVPIIPGVTVSIYQFLYIAIALVLSITIHELMHALASTSEGITVKSIGLFVLAVFPGAFVEPDEEGLNLAKRSSRIRIISAGIAINLIMALLFLALFTPLVNTASNGVLIVSVNSTYPAGEFLHPGDVIVRVNNITIRDVNQLSSVEPLPPKVSLTILTNGTVMTLRNLTTKGGKLGIYVEDDISASFYPIVNFVFWMYVVNFSLAALNALPLIITDGGKLFNEVLGRLISNTKTLNSLQSIFLALLAIAILLSLVR